jgi:hypothetical protein
MDYRRENSEFENSARQMQMPFGPSQLPFTGVVDAVLKANSKAQAETTTLVARRAQAWVELPSRTAQCRSPQDLVQLQTRFWQTLWQHYADAGRSIGEAWMPVWTPWMSSIARLPSHSVNPWLPWQSAGVQQRDVMDVQPQREPASDFYPGSRRAA